LADKIAAVASNADSKAGGLINKAFGESLILNGEELDARLSADSEGASELMNATE